MTAIRFAEPLVAARFIRRLNRFAALVRVEGREERVHVRNSGRLRELLTAGRMVLLSPATARGRRTRFTLALVRLRGGYASVDAHLPNDLIAGGFAHGGIAGFRGYRLLRREPAMGRHRADFLLGRSARRCLLEVKSVTLVRDGIALFPDAPTARGVAHLEHLIAARADGTLAAVLFVIQRTDAVAFVPNRRGDPTFAAALRRAARAGVRVQAIRCQVTPAAVSLDRRVPVRLRP